MDKVHAGRTAFITGSTSGIGLAIAKSLAVTGARIAVHGLADQAQIDEVCETLKQAGAPEVSFFAGDMRDGDAIAAMMDAVNAWCGDAGGPDILVNNAGMQKTAALESVNPDLWNQIIAVNLSGAYHTMLRCVPNMAKRGYGRVINISSVHGLVASVQKAPYVASKFGLVGLSKVVALEYANAGSADSGGVTVNCICPGWTKTGLIEPQVHARAELFGGDQVRAIEDLLAEKQPSRRMSSPEDIGELVLFLTSRAAHNITGAAIPIDGGWTAQ